MEESGLCDPNVDPKQPPEKLHKGRIAGSTNRFSKSSVQKLRELGVDPIEYQVEIYNEVCKEIKELQSLKDAPKVLRNGDTRRYSAMAHAQLLVIKQKIANDLMRYGYARTPETVNVKPAVPKGITINLTPKGGVFTPEDVVDVDTVDDDKDD